MDKKNRSKTREKYGKTYVAWESMRQRCLTNTHISSKSYFGRGITICERWGNFKNFLADMGEKPEGKSIGRIDNDGNYEPSNCEWQTKWEQERNKRTNRFIEYNGEVLILSDWAAKAGLDKSCLGRRLARGWSFEKAINTPPKPMPWNAKEYRNKAGQ